MKADELAACRDEVNRENRMAIRLLGMMGLPLALANMVVQLALAPETELTPFFLRTSWVLVSFLLLLAVERWVIPQDFSHTTAVLYILEAPILICSILLGSVWDPNNQAITFFIFLMAMPVFVLDRPIRVMLITTGWVVLFLITCYLVKPPDIFARDCLHAFEFYLAAIAVANTVIGVRIVGIERLEQVRYSSEHDELTGLQNRRALNHRISKFTETPLTVLVAEMNQMDMINDVYGYEMGNNVLARVAEVLTEVFGHDSAYRYGGDELLCIVEGAAEDECQAAIKQVHAQLRSSCIGDQMLALTCSVGYATGTPRSEDELRHMIQLADIYAHQASVKGASQTIGGAFSEESLRAGIVESNLETHLSGQETNQLTGLPSMSYFVSCSESLLATIVVHERSPMIGFVALPHIKSYNNEFGYAQGDELIRHTADLLREAFPSRLMCSIAGNQFGVMCYKDEIESGMQAVNEGLRAFKEDRLTVCKAGFAECVEGESSIMLLDKARAAEKSIRDEHDVYYRFYDDQLDESIKFGDYIVSHLDEAIEQGFLEVYYQPIVRTSTREICEEEALSRWNDPDHGMIAPYRFIPPLEESRQLYKLSLHVVQRVLDDFKRKRDAGVTLVPVSVNLSRHDFSQCDMVQAISDLVDASGFSRDMLRIEITESAFAENQEFLKREVARFRQSGFEVWMDDFGSEYSTLNMLKDLDFDLVKIDMEFMRGSEDSTRNLIIVSSVINMIEQMGIATLVEGVENEEHLGILRAMGCDKMQGYLFSKPMPLQCIIDKVNKGTAMTFEKRGV